MSNKMEDLEKLTDSELRHRLLQYGFPNMPVTETTRKILIKKLRNHLTNEKAKLKRQTNYVTRYSSDEESDQTPISPSTIRGRSSVMSNFRTSSSSLNKTTPNKMPPPSSPIVLTRRSAAAAANLTSPPAPYNKTTTSSYSSPSSRYSSSPKQKTSPKIYVPPPILASESEEDSDYLAYTPKQYNNTPPPASTWAYTSPYVATTPNNLTLDRSLNCSWNTSSMYQNNSPISHVSPPSNNSCNGQGSNNDLGGYGGDFTKRLLKLRGETIRDSILQKRTSTGIAKQPLRQIHTTPSVDPSDIVYHQPERSDNNISPSTAFAQLVARLDEQYGFKQTFIPCALVSILLLFFFFVAFFYMTISPDLISTINEKNTEFTICNPHHADSAIATAGYSCVEQDQLPSAVLMLKHLMPELQKRAEVHFCKDVNQDPTINAREFVKHLHKMGLTTDVRKTLKDLHNAEYLIEKNPQWKIRHVSPISKEIMAFHEVVKLRPTQGNAFALENPRLPITCTISNKIQQFFVVIGSATLLAVAVLAIHIGYRFIQSRRKTRADAVEYYTNEIIAELMRKAISPDSTQPDVVVNHLRDKLIPLHKRKQMQSAWNEAIQNLELNDSRIQFDLALRNGEECKTMKWIANVSADMLARTTNTLKQWHSPAFDKSNKIANPPTNCLKIRQMFEPLEANNPNLKTIIQDAILEKVGPKCKIYDIQLDKQSCCVYVRCATEHDAGIVHNEINGWWFDKRLVSIKFLRLQRYLSRFPKSASGPMCLHPSNANNSSMTQCSKDFAGVVNGVNDEEDDDDDDDEMDEEEN
ncbi:inner nuclear membrane protein Man1 [Episyrphus balteatus]|uniref:inner nuclear membrane protein Man1 n=1 Tax=Episyrphus balteatus TaxID=286459 RepID=UPI002486AD62|nr:inner nuclear membrane protein Man1 [Episyrphus balteatus]XP_055839452.1 inner nuclear membrane protein Man1 [Episyrphus balteatus]XP_055839453.1 inner nuclear membrane protein Man1 [Episyrphus balteatus]